MSEPVLDAVRAGFARSDRVFWLDGGGARDWSGRRSLVGVLDEDDVSLSLDASRREVTRHRGGRSEVVGDDVFAVLEEEIARDDGDPDVHWVGCFGYAARPDLPARPSGTGPDAVWMRSRTWRSSSTVVCPSTRPGASRGTRPTPPGWYAEAFAGVQEQLRAGNSYEVNLTYRDEAGAVGDPLATYLRLRASNPAPYAGLLSHRGTHLLSSSPERYATDRPAALAGDQADQGHHPARRDARGRRAAAPRARDRPEVPRREPDDRRPAPQRPLDGLRGGHGRACRSLMAVESYPSVHQLVSTVRGRLRPDVSTLGALRALFPAGSMTGAPKLRTMQVIDQLEGTPRGLYAGAFGWICADGRADLGVVIRSLFAGPGGPWWLGTGGGITVRSDLHEEWAETLWKAERLRAAAPAPG